MIQLFCRFLSFVDFGCVRNFLVGYYVLRKTGFYWILEFFSNILCFLFLFSVVVEIGMGVLLGLGGYVVVGLGVYLIFIFLLLFQVQVEIKKFWSRWILVLDFKRKVRSGSSSYSYGFMVFYISVINVGFRTGFGLFFSFRLLFVVIINGYFQLFSYIKLGVLVFQIILFVVVIFKDNGFFNGFCLGLDEEVFVLERLFILLQEEWEIVM